MEEEGGCLGMILKPAPFSPSKLKSLCQDSPSELNIPQSPPFPVLLRLFYTTEKGTVKLGMG